MIKNLRSAVLFEKDEVKSGGTASVVNAKLIDPSLIEKHRISDVAVKLVKGENEKAIDESFKYEVAIMSALPESPYLVQFIGYCTKPLAIVMKKYAMSLQDCFQNSEFFLDESKKLKAAKEIAMGMQIVHSKNIIHFDLKPGKMKVP